MSINKYLCMYRGAPGQNKPSRAQMQEMFTAFNEWKEKFKDSILDMGSKLKSSGKVVTASGATDGPFAQGKESSISEYCSELRATPRSVG